MLHTLLRPLLPYRLRVLYRLIKRYMSDRNLHLENHFAKVDDKNSMDKINFKYQIKIEQPIIATAQVLEKIENIRIAGNIINKISIEPNKILSFWHILGEPSAAKGYQKGRNIIDGRLVEDTGGGLCQLASILYHIALIGGCTVVERHNHSVDIYKTDAERFTPLGADATLVYPFKDLRLCNPYPFSIRFEIQLSGEKLTAFLHSEGFISEKEISFRIKNRSSEYIELATSIDNIENKNTAIYKINNL